MPLSAEMARVLRGQLMASHGTEKEPELHFLEPLFDRQKEESIVPKEDEFLMEYFETDEGFHLLVYPFEGRFVHEGMGALLAYRLSLLRTVSVSIAMNDYGFELLSDTPIDVDQIVDNNLFSLSHLSEDIRASINATEMARRKFRDIASISGLVFKGYPGHVQKEKHIQSSSQLFFDVFSDHEPDNLLMTEAFEEVMTFQLEEYRMRKALERINSQKIVVARPNKPTPLAFPIMVDRLNREKLTNESLTDQIKKMKLAFE